MGKLYQDLQKPRHTLLAPGQFRGPAGAWYQDNCRMLRRVTQPTHIAGLLKAITNSQARILFSGNPFVNHFFERKFFQ